ncbi:hypothetical protein RB597_003101 [Gaeumannomyces tritici]
MMRTTLPKRFLTLRDRDRSGGAHRRSKSSDPHHKRPFAADAFFAIFRDRGLGNEEKESNQKIDELVRWVEEEGLSGVTRDQIRYVLSSTYSRGDIAKAKELLKLQSEAFEGVLLPYNANTHMLGAENRGAVTCYLDSLLFAMFAKMGAFECMLMRREYPDEAHRNLAALLRLWVNMLRSGKLIGVEMTEHIQNALAACGWSDASLLEQQDTSEAFAFITETLQLPLLTLQVDLFHQGKGDADDHKVVFERLLNLAVPADPEGKGVKLEDCLEEYFNTRVDVLRDSPDDKKSADRQADSPITSVLGPKNTIRVVTDIGQEEHDEAHDKVENLTPLQRRWTNIDSPASSSSTPTRDRPETRPSPRARSTSIIQRVVLDAEGKPTGADASTILQKVKRQGSTVVKAVTIPAWQFFRLIPWHSTGKDEPLNDTDVARHLNTRPVVGICLKRYMMTELGQPRRQNTFIDIPDSMRLPHFMLVNDAKVEESNGLSAEYKLVLQSVVCHRGESLHSGHYVAFSRVAPKLLTDNRRHDKDPPPDYEDAQWVMFDDLQVEDRVVYVDDIKESLKDEMPYLLFYQIVPMMDVTAASVDGTTSTEPPSYNDSTINITATTSGTASYSPTTNTDSERPDMSRQTSGYFDGAPLGSSTGPSVRFSSELDRPVRLSLDNELETGVLDTNMCATSSRRSSVPFSEVTSILNVRPPAEAQTPAGPAAANEEPTTAHRLSRAAARFTKKDRGDKEASKEKERCSRPASQAGEGRMSLTMSRLGGLMRTSKEPLRESVSLDQASASTVQDAYDGEAGSAQHVEQQPLIAPSSSPPLSAVPGDASGKKESKEKNKNKSDIGRPDKEGRERKHHLGHHRKSNGSEPERECVVM